MPVARLGLTGGPRYVVCSEPWHEAQRMHEEQCIQEEQCMSEDQPV